MKWTTCLTPVNLAVELPKIMACPKLAVDTETTGLSPIDHVVFAIAFTDGDTIWWTDFRTHGLSIESFSPLWADPTKTWIAHNAKFDAAMIESTAGVRIQGKLHCTHVMARVEFNDHMKYGLDACAKRMGLEPKEDIKTYMKEHGLFERVPVPGKKRIDTNFLFHKVPTKIIESYICHDVELAWQVYWRQQITFATYSTTGRSVEPLIELEQKITRIVVDMEKSGVRVDRGYCEKALAYEDRRRLDAGAEFERISGVPFVDSEKTFVPVFESFHLPYGKTEKGNASFTDDVLAPVQHEVAVSIRKYRDAAKRTSTYFTAFLHYSESDGRIHPSFNQGGTATSRFSSSNPNFQNLTSDEEDGEYPIRRCFIPDPDTILVSCDYSQMEYRLMLDYAGEMEVIRQVISGVDLHQACANMMGVDRRSAKTINFALLYGAGIEKLAAQLGVSSERAQELKFLYFRTLPEVRNLVRAIIDKAKYKGQVVNWLGRRYHFPNRDFAYKAPNYLIQGGSADIMRIGMLNVANLFEGTRSKIIAVIHDELVALVHKSELHLVEGIREGMIKAYKPRYLPMDANLYYSTKSLYDLEKWNGEETRNSILGEYSQARLIQA